MTNFIQLLEFQILNNHIENKAKEKEELTKKKWDIKKTEDSFIDN